MWRAVEATYGLTQNLVVSYHVEVQKREHARCGVGIFVQEVDNRHVLGAPDEVNIAKGSSEPLVVDELLERTCEVERRPTPVRLLPPPVFR